MRKSNSSNGKCAGNLTSQSKHRHSHLRAKNIAEALESRRLLSAGFIFGFSSEGPHGAAATISKYLPSGQELVGQQIGSPVPNAIDVVGSHLLVLGQQVTGIDASGPSSVLEYTLDGKTVNSSLISNLPFPQSMAIAGSDIFITLADGRVSEYTTAGTLVKAALISGLKSPEGIAVSGNDLFVESTDANGTTQKIGEYTLAGAAVKTSLITGISPTTFFTGGQLVAVGNDLFVTTASGIAQYTTAGKLIKPAFTSSNAYGLTAANGNVFIADTSRIAEYTTAGTLLNTYPFQEDSTYGIFAVAPSAAKGSALHAAFATEPDAENLVIPQNYNQPIVVALEDQHGNLASGVAGSASLSIVSGPSGGKLVGKTTLPLVDGAAVFNSIMVNSTGTYVLRASSNVAASSNSNSADVTTLYRFLSFNARSAEYLTPTDIVTPPIAVSIDDVNGKLVTNATNPITLSLLSGPTGATLGGTTTVAAVNGVATFQNLTLSQPGTYVLSASDGVDYSGNSGSLTVVLQPAGSVSGAVYNDTAGSGTNLASDKTVPNETVYADLNNSGHYIAGDPVATTDNTGHYVLSNVPAGPEIIRIVLQSIDQGTQRQSYPAGGSGQHVNVGLSAITGVNFSVTNDIFVSGTVSLPAGAAPVQVFADLNNNGKLDAGEPVVTTSSNGSFFFNSLAAGKYTFRVVIPSGDKQTAPANNAGILVTLGTGGVNTHLAFALAAATPKVSTKVLAVATE